MSDKYILDGHEVVECDDVGKWVIWIVAADIRVDKTTIGEVKISTMFLGFDRNLGDGEPQLFETLIFGGEFDREVTRYATWEQAEQGHKEAINRVKGVL